MAHIVQPRGSTPRPRSGEEAGSTPCPRGGSQEELPDIRGQGQRPRVPGGDDAGMAERRNPLSKVTGGGREELPHVQGVVAAQAQEDLFHIKVKRGQW